MKGAIEIHWEGLRQVAQSLRETDRGLLAMLERELAVAGEITRDDAERRFSEYGASKGRPGKYAATIAASASSFEVRVRTSGASQALVVVGQHRRSTGLVQAKRPGYGSLQMRKALLPARTATHDRGVAHLEDGAMRLLHQHGF